jgi:RHS repeat-associated protein
VATLRPTGIGNPTPIAIYYVHADHLGSPRAVTRPSDNVMMWQWDNLDPFGVNAANENPAGQGTFKYALRFPGQYYDAETATHYNYYRDYDPTIGRYVESDPVGLGGGINTYAYAQGNALSYVDKMGLASCTGEWVLEGTDRSPMYQSMFNPFFPFCWCYWLCMDCDSPIAWGGDFHTLPRTRGIWTHTGGGGGGRVSPPRPGRPGQPMAPGQPRGDFGDTCNCLEKPGPETGCFVCKAPAGYNNQT